MTDIGSFESFQREFAPEFRATWQRIFDRHHGTIKIRKTRLALPNLEIIINSTLKICNASSFSAMSLRHLSQTTELSMGALYSYIESKDLLLEMILEEVLHVVEAVLASEDLAGLEAPQRLNVLIRRHIYLSEVMQPWFFFAYMEAKTFGDWGRRMAVGSELRTQGLIADCLSAGQASGVFKRHDTIMTASLIKPLLQDWYLKRWKYRHNKVSPNDYADWVIRFTEAFVLATERSTLREQGSFVAR